MNDGDKQDDDDDNDDDVNFAGQKNSQTYRRIGKQKKVRK